MPKSYLSRFARIDKDLVTRQDKWWETQREDEIPKNNKGRERKKVESIFRTRVFNTLIFNLLKNKLNTDAEIARRLADAGLSVDSERIRQLRSIIMPDRISGSVYSRNEFLRKILNIKQKYPDASYDDVCEILGVPKDTFLNYCFRKKIKLRRSSKISEKEMRERLDWVQQRKLRFIKGTKTRSIVVMESRYNHLKEVYDFIPQDFQFLSVNSKVADIKIKLCEELGIDWRNNTFLVSSSTGRILKQNEYLRSIGASHELDYLFYYGFETLIKALNTEKYNYLINAVKQKDMVPIYKFVENILGHFLKLNNKGFKNMKEYLDIAKDALLEVYENCSEPENNPALFLALISQNVRHRVQEYRFKRFKEISEQEFLGIPDYDTDQQPRRRSRDS